MNLFLEGEVEFRTLQSICDLCPDLNKLLLLESTIHAADKIGLDQSTQTELKKCFGQLKKVVLFFSKLITILVDKKRNNYIIFYSPTDLSDSND